MTTGKQIAADFTPASLVPELSVAAFPGAGGEMVSHRRGRDRRAPIPRARPRRIVAAFLGLDRGTGASKDGKARRSVSRVLSCRATGMAIHLGRSLPNASRDRPERRRESSPGTVSRACRSYLVLLPVGFSLPSPLLATRCALTAPFHPCRPCDPMRDRLGLGGVFSVALSLGSPPPAVNRHRAFRGARTFLPLPCGEERPSDHLAVGFYGALELSVKIECPERSQFEFRLWVKADLRSVALGRPGRADTSSSRNHQAATAAARFGNFTALTLPISIIRSAPTREEAQGHG